MRGGRWRIASASAIGTSHVAAGTPCQDKAVQQLVETSEGPVLVAVVCDGAGSSVYAETGAALAASSFVQQICSYFESGRDLAAIDRGTACRWIENVAGALVTQAAETNHRVRDYACTLLAAIVGPDAAAFIQIGDGAIVVSHGPEDGWTYVFWPQHGEFANTTNFVISPGIEQLVDFDLALRRIEDLAIFSDGIENLVLHKASKSVHEPFFTKIFSPLRTTISDGLDERLSEALESYLSSPQICERTDDDKTLILATRSPLPTDIHPA